MQRRNGRVIVEAERGPEQTRILGQRLNEVCSVPHAQQRERDESEVGAVLDERGVRLGQTATTASSAVVEKLPRVMLADFCSWMPYNMLAFRFVPLHLRPTTTALMTTCWQTYLSWESHRRRAA